MLTIFAIRWRHVLMGVERRTGPTPADGLPFNSSFGQALRARKIQNVIVPAVTLQNAHCIQGARNCKGCRRFLPHPHNRCCKTDCQAGTGSGNSDEHTFLGSSRLWEQFRKPIVTSKRKDGARRVNSPCPGSFGGSCTYAIDAGRGQHLNLVISMRRKCRSP